MNELALSLSFLYRFSLSSLIYGAGPQLNEIMELEGVVPDYVQGTSEYVLSSNKRS
jgi:N-acetyl-gamma-glutamyl-phosphate reductase/acetylglutamate kinase